MATKAKAILQKQYSRHKKVYVYKDMESVTASKWKITQANKKYTYEKVYEYIHKKYIYRHTHKYNSKYSLKFFVSWEETICSTC